MNQQQLNEVLENHKKWLETRDSDAVEGCRANLREADLRDTNMRDANMRAANMRDANLRGANMREADLRGTDLRGADLRAANMCYANMRNADMRGANMREADLRGADMCDADLLGVDIDYSCWPLWCGGLHVHIDDRQAVQLLYHLLSCALYSRNTSAELKSVLSAPELVATANKFHRVDECGLICAEKESAPCTAATVQGADENSPNAIVDERKEVVKG